jgi:hypothetical protein
MILYFPAAHSKNAGFASIGHPERGSIIIFVRTAVSLFVREHDPEKRKPVFRKDHAQQRDEITMRFRLIAS